MPYPLEKGEFSVLVERFFNDGLDRVPFWATPRRILRRYDGPRRRLRAIWRYCNIAHELRQAQASAGSRAAVATVTRENSFVHSSFFGDGTSKHLSKLQAILARDWFGMESDGASGWRRPGTSAATKTTSLGHWFGYYGNVELILCEALQRMLEVSLGVEHQTTPPTSPAEQQAFETRLRNDATRVWPVYLFVTCPQPWMGAWVTWQRHHPKSALRGQVTVLLQTPGHDRALAPSPVDRESDSPAKVIDGIETKNPYYLHGKEAVAHNSGYDGIYLTPDGHRQGSDPTAAAASQGMWLVTHENHDSTLVWTSFTEPGGFLPNWPPEVRARNQHQAEAWELPPIAVYRCAKLEQRADLEDLAVAVPLTDQIEGFGSTVVVQPASLDGGIPSDAHP